MQGRKNKIWMLVVGLFSFGPVAAQTQSAAGVSDSLASTKTQYFSQKHFHAQYKKAAMEFRFSERIKHVSYNEWRSSFLSRLKTAVGLTKLEQMLPGYVPTAEMQDSEDAGTFTRQRWIIWTEPTVPLPMVVLIPKNAKGKTPLVITPHGHGRNSEMYAGIYKDDEEKEQAEKTERNVGIQAVNEGYIVIAPTGRGFGETRTESDKIDDKPFSCRLHLMHNLLIGRTNIGDRVWDISKIIDWALVNMAVDDKKIAVTGNSAGGTTSLFAAACDERITVAAPSAYFSTFTGSIGTIAHCDCNYIPGILDLGEMADIAGLIAPRALSMVNGKEDKIYPIEEARIAAEALRQIYKAADAEDKVAFYEGDGGHRYFKDGVWPFFQKHFDGKAVKK